MVRLAGWLATAGVLALLALYASDGGTHEGRVSFVWRLVIWIAFALGIATPHLLLPDPHLRLRQLANPTARRLWSGQILRWLPIPLALAAAPVAVALQAPAEVGLAVQSGWAVVLIGLLALALFATLGERSWDWQDGRRGGWLKAFIRRAPLFRLFVPYGLVPGLAATLWVALVGGALATAGLVFDARGWGLWPILVGATVILWPPRAFDRAFYATNGFWAETFHAAPGEEARAPAPFEAVYWVPRPLKPSVWALLVSLDRRLPLGRVVVVGVAVVVALAATGAPEGVVGAALGVLVLAKSAAVALTASASVLPRPWSLSIQSPMRWTLARAFVNARWLPLVAVAVVLAGWLGDRPGSLVGWIALDLAIGVLFAGLVTLAAEDATRRRLA